jgi:hypothetical protein
MALQPQDVERLNVLLNGDGEVEYGGMAQMYVAAWGPRQKLQDWVNAKVEGMLCLVLEYRTGKHFFMIFDVRTGEVIYEFELYQGIFYREAMPNFHAYETSDGYVGFGFLSSRVAKQFHEVVTNRASSAEQLMSGAFFNDDGSINLAQLPGQWKKLLQDAGFTSEELNDPAFTGMIVQVLQEVGLATKAPERNLTRQQLLAQGYTPEQVLTYEQYMRDLAAYEEQLRQQNTQPSMSVSAPPPPTGRGSAVSAGGSNYYMAGYERAGSGYDPYAAQQAQQQYGDLQRGSQYSAQSQQAYESRPRGGSQQAYDSRLRGGSQQQQPPPERSPRDQQQSKQTQQQQGQQSQMQQQQQRPPPPPKQQQQQQQQQKAQQTPASKQQQQQPKPQQLKPQAPPPQQQPPQQQQPSKRASLAQQLRRSMGSLMSSSSKSSQAQAESQAQAPRQQMRQSPAQPSESPSYGESGQDAAAGQRAPRRKKEQRYEQGTFGGSASKLAGAATPGRKKPGQKGPAPVAPQLPAMLADIREPLQGLGQGQSQGQGQGPGQGRTAPAPRPGPGGLLAGDLLNGAAKLKPPRPNLAQLRSTVLPDIAGMQAAKQSDLLARLAERLNDRRKRIGESDSDDDKGTTDADWK